MTRGHVSGIELAVYALCSQALIPCLGQPAPKDDRPDALIQLERQRAQLVTGRVELSNAEVVGGKRLLRNFTARFCVDGATWCNRGDDEGVIVRDELGRPSTVVKNPLHMLKYAGNVWHYQEQARQAKVYSQKTSAGAPDLRTLGVSVGLGDRDIHDTLWKDAVALPGPRKYHQSVEGELIVVSAETDTTLRKWWIDPKRGWSPVRAAVYVDGKLFREARSALRQFDGAWFPERVEFYAPSYRDGQEPVQVIQVESATFNRPDHPYTLTPNEIGVRAGTGVTVFDENDAEVAHDVWDGQRIVTDAEYARGLSAATPAPPEERRLSPPHGDRLADTTHGLSAWERYTRDFIGRYRLNDEQAQRAWSILHACQDQAHTYLARRRGEFQKLEARMADLNSADQHQRPARKAAIEREYRKLYEPIDHIFEEQLKPRLDKLPTRAQRKAVDADERKRVEAKPPPAPTNP